MAKDRSNERGPSDFATGVKAATIVVVLGLIAALADHSMVTPSEPASARIAPDVTTERYAGPDRLVVPFTVTTGDVEPPAATF